MVSAMELRERHKRLYQYLRQVLVIRYPHFLFCIRAFLMLCVGFRNFSYLKLRDFYIILMSKQSDRQFSNFLENIFQVYKYQQNNSQSANIKKINN